VIMMWGVALLFCGCVALSRGLSVEQAGDLNGVVDEQREAIVTEAFRADGGRGRSGKQLWGFGGKQVIAPASTIPMSPMAQLFCQMPSGGFAFCNSNYQFGGFPGMGWPGIQGQYPGMGGAQYPGVGAGGQYPGAGAGGQYPGAGGGMQNPWGQYPGITGQYPGAGQPAQPAQPVQPVQHPTHPPLPTHPPVQTQPPTTTQAPYRPPTTTQAPYRPPVAASEAEVPASTGSSGSQACGVGKYYPIRYNQNGSVAEEIERITLEHPTRVVNGWPADKGEWPWIAALLNNDRQFCGGSLIDQNHILTAAHCVAHMSRYDVANLKVRLGDHQIKTKGETEIFESKASRVVRHKGFSQQTLHEDVAIITLETPVPLGLDNVRPVCLPPQGGVSYAGETATVVGWGSLKENGPQPDTLQEVTVKIWENSVCKETYGNAAPGGIQSHMLCAGQKGKDSCSGDSGGPMQIGSGSTWTQIGVVSWGIGCGKSHYPGVYSRITELRDWIDKITNKY